MSLVLYGLGIIINGIVGVLPDLSTSISANIIYDNTKKIYNSITIHKRHDLHTLHPVIETALVSSFYNAIILSLTKTRDYYKRTSNYVYKKEILQISARIKDLSKHLKSQSSSGYAVLLDSFCVVMGNSNVDNAKELIKIAKNNLIGLPEKTQSDLESGFVGIFLLLFKEKYASNEVLKSLLTFDMLQTNISVSIDTNKKIDSLIYAHINIESELSNISSAVSNLPTYNDHTEIRTMLIGIQQTLLKLVQEETKELSSDVLLQRSYLDVIYNKYKYVEFPSFDGARRRTNIKDIYVPLELINRIAVTIDKNGQVTKMAILDIDEYNKSNSSQNPFIIEKRFLNHPVVGVSFHDAIKYCQWLNTKIIVPHGYKIWLPSDPEWMKMYRGGKIINGISNDIPDRIYPWGNEWIEGYGNLPKLKYPICSTTAVGIFVEGISKYGCYDSCGNVLEWTTTSWGGTNPDVPEYQHPYTPLDGRENLELPGLRITRGGSFLFSEGDAKCSCRLDPESKFPDTGFRIFMVPDKNL